MCCWRWEGGSANKRKPQCYTLSPQVPGKYTVLMDGEKGGSDTLAMRSGDMVEVVEEGTEGLW